MPANHDRFIRNIDNVPMQRERLRKSNLPKRIIIAGRKIRELEKAKNKLEALGSTVVALYSPQETSAKEALGLPLLNSGDARISKLKARMVVVGKPRKLWFCGDYPEIHQCLWYNELDALKLSGWHMPDLLSDYSQQVELLWKMLEHDPVSLKIYASILKSRITGNTGYMKISDLGEYQHPLVRAKEHDYCFDVGAFQGDTALLFGSQVGPAGKVFSLEPSPPNYKVLKDNIIASPYAEICHSICMGAWNESGHINFDYKDSTGGSSRISEDASDKVEVKPIDQIVNEFKLNKLDLIKFDVEGVEHEALCGARGSIDRYRPKLMVSMYHYDYDLFSLSQQLFDMLPNYQFYLAHHNYYRTETDLYCMPKERLS